jgi:hypothetical protein
MTVTDRLTAQGCQPRKTTCEEFFRTHAGLLDEVRAAYAAGYTWPQIVKDLGQEYGWRISATSLRIFAGDK